MVEREESDNYNLSVGDNIFDQVQEFRYLGTILNSKNNMHGKINIRLGAANRCLYALKNLFKSKQLSMKTKKKLYLSYIRPVLTYAYATYTTTSGEEENPCVFKRKVVRKKYVPVFNNMEQKLEIRSNAQLYQL